MTLIGKKNLYWIDILESNLRGFINQITQKNVKRRIKTHR